MTLCIVKLITQKKSFQWQGREKEEDRPFWYNGKLINHLNKERMRKKKVLGKL